MPSYRVALDIAASVEDVYTRVADLAGHRDWSSDPLEVVQIGEDEFTSTARSKGKTIHAALHVVERRPPSNFAFEVSDLTGTWVNRFTLEPIASGTRVQRVVSGTLRGTQLLLYWLVVYPVKKPNARRSLEKLKALAEANSPKTN